MTGNKKPKVGITMGDPAGVGPEVVVKALSKRHIYEISRPILIGDTEVMEKAAEICDIDCKINRISKVEDAVFKYGTIDVYDIGYTDISKLEYGKVSKMCGNASYRAIERVISLALDNEIDATVTAPINKEALNLAGFRYSGHTEIYAKLTNTSRYTMMLAEGNLRVVHVSTHVSLKKACELVKKERILETIKLAYNACRKLGIEKPKIAVAALNPHAGENGLFGSEEDDEIIPAIADAKVLGMDAEGPVPADTVFSKAKGGMFDIVVAMYHDQGHIPLKTTGFNWNEKKKGWESVSGVNITLGLPIIRTSVDHGTAFDIAGRGAANEESMLSAIEYAVQMAKRA